MSDNGSNPAVEKKTPSVRLIERRRLVFRYWARQYSTEDIVKELNRTHGVIAAPRTIRNDIQHMEEWLPDVLHIYASLEELRDATGEMLARLRYAQNALIMKIPKTKTDGAYIRATEALLGSLQTEAALRQRLGLVPTQATEINVTHQTREAFEALSRVIVGTGDPELIQQAEELLNQVDRLPNARDSK